MSYIGNEPTSVAFLTDTFSGNGSTTAFTLSQAPATTSSIIVAVSGVLQDPSTYSISGTTLTFSGAPPTGSSNISVRFLGIPASGVTTTAYRTVTEFTATSGQTTFSVPSYTAGFIDVYRNGVMLGSADYTATNGTTVVLASGATAGDLVEVISFYVSSVLNAIPATTGSVGESYLASGSVTPAKLSTGGLYWDTSSNVGIGTSSPVGRLTVENSSTTVEMTLRSTGGVGTNNRGRIIAGYQSGGSDYGGYLAFNTTSSSNANTEQMRIDMDGNLKFNSGYGSVATAYGCRAWVQFNGTGTVAINGSGNVSSITDNATGDYTVNFSTSMPDTNYSVVAGCVYVAGSGVLRTLQRLSDKPATTSGVSVIAYQEAGGAVDPAICDVAVFR